MHVYEKDVFRIEAEFEISYYFCVWNFVFKG